MREKHAVETEDEGHPREAPFLGEGGEDVRLLVAGLCRRDDRQRAHLTQRPVGTDARAERHRLDDVAAAAVTGIDDDRHAFADSVKDRRQRFNRRQRTVDDATAPMSTVATIHGATLWRIRRTCAGSTS